MSLEATINFTLAYSDDDGASDSIQLTDATRTTTTTKYTKLTQTIGITEEALILGECTSPAELAIKNLDPTNFVEVRVATGGAKFAKLFPGKGMLVPLGSGAQAPYLIADTAPVKIEYLLIST